MCGVTSFTAHDLPKQESRTGYSQVSEIACEQITTHTERLFMSLPSFIKLGSVRMQSLLCQAMMSIKTFSSIPLAGRKLQSIRHIGRDSLDRRGGISQGIWVGMVVGIKHTTHQSVGNAIQVPACRFPTIFSPGHHHHHKSKPPEDQGSRHMRRSVADRDKAAQSKLLVRRP